MNFYQRQRLFAVPFRYQPRHSDRAARLNHSEWRSQYAANVEQLFRLCPFNFGIHVHPVFP